MDPVDEPTTEPTTLQKIEEYATKRFVYQTKARCIANYYWLGLASAGMIVLGWIHVLVMFALITLERFVHYNTMPEAVGVSAMATSMAGYLVAMGVMGKGYTVVILGMLSSVGHIYHGMVPFNLAAHLFPFLTGLIIGTITTIIFPSW